MKSELARRGVIAIGLEGTYMSTAATGTGHGTPYYYDRSVPLIFLGADVEPARRTRLARTVDLAPTLAGLAGIAAPDDLDGEQLVVGTPR
jgi:arylsulfatase A-like enzyme